MTGPWSRLVLELRVKAIVIDDDVQVTARVIPEIWEAQSDLEARPYKFLAQETHIDPPPTTSAGDAVLATLPPDWIEPHGHPFVYIPTPANAGLVVPPLNWESLDEEAIKVYPSSYLNPDSNQRARPTALMENIAEGEIWTLPISDQAYTIWVPYYKRLPNLLLNISTNWWTGALFDHLVFRAAARVLDFNRDQKEALKYELKAEAAYKKAKKADRRKRYRMQQNRIRPRRDVGGRFDQRRM